MTLTFSEMVLLRRWALVFLVSLSMIDMEADGSALGTFTRTPGTVCSGQDITYTCTLHDVGGNGSSSDLVIQHNKISVDPDQIQIQDNRTVVYTLYNVSYLPESHRLVCCLGRCDGDKSNMVGELQVLHEVLEAPRPVENIKCVVYDYNVRMTCTIEYETDYTIAPYFASIYLEMKFRFSFSWVNCTRLSTDYTQFTCDGIDFYQAARFIYGRVAIKSVCGLPVYSRFSLADVKYIQPAPPVLKETHVANTTCVQVNITSKTFTRRKKRYRLTYRLLGKNLIPGNIIETLLVNGTNSPPLVCGLLPFQTYTFSVEASAQDGLCCRWSDPANITLTRPPAAPAASPKMLSGMFTWKRTDCQNNGIRVVHVYTQSIEELFWNGDKEALVFRYRSLSREDDDKMKNESPNATYTSLRLQCHLDYEVRVQVRNEIGWSPDNSSICVPAADKVSDTPAFIVEHTDTDGEVTFEWVEDIPTSVSRYTIYWCQRDREENCAANSVIHWKIVENVNERKVLVNVGSHVLIGASIETDGGRSSGLRWESCIYTHNGVPRKPEVNVEVGSDTNSLYVTWEKLLCKTGQPYISHYVVTYCALSSSEHCPKSFSKTVPSSQDYLMLTDLDAELEYSVRVQGVARNGSHGYRSDTVIKQPKGKSLATDDIVSITCVSVAVVVIVTAVCVTYRRVRRHIRSPEIDDLKIDKPCDHTENKVPSPEDDANKGEDEDDDEVDEEDDDKLGNGPVLTLDLTNSGRAKHVKKFRRTFRRMDSGLPESPTDEQTMMLPEDYDLDCCQPPSPGIHSMHSAEYVIPTSKLDETSNVGITTNGQCILNDAMSSSNENDRQIAGYDDFDARAGSVGSHPVPDYIHFHCNTTVSHIEAEPGHLKISLNSAENDDIGQACTHLNNCENDACNDEEDTVNDEKDITLLGEGDTVNDEKDITLLGDGDTVNDEKYITLLGDGDTVNDEKDITLLGDGDTVNDEKDITLLGDGDTVNDEKYITLLGEGDRVNDEKDTTLLNTNHVEDENILTNVVCTTALSDVAASDQNSEMIPNNIDNEIHSTTYPAMKNMDSSYDIYQLQEQATMVTEDSCLSEKQSVVPAPNTGILRDTENVYAPMLETQQESLKYDPLLDGTSNVVLLQLDTMQSCNVSNSPDAIHAISLEHMDETQDAMGDGMILSNCNTGDGGYLSHDSLLHRSI